MRDGMWARWVLGAVLGLLVMVVLGGCSAAYGAQSPTAREAYAGGEELWIVPTGPRFGQGAGVMAPSLAARGENGQMTALPLRHTDVRAVISGYIASVEVVQQFTNSSTRRIEAVYEFPLPENAGVNEFTMTIGVRHIRGIIRERAEAERIYRAARGQGYVASMMTQARPSVFTQNVANIEPGKSIDITLRYFHTLRYDAGWLEWEFPMKAGAQAGAEGAAGGAGGMPLERSGRDISLRVELDAGVAVETVASSSHRISMPAPSAEKTGACVVELAAADAIPNQDFVLRYKVAGDKVKAGLVVQKDKEGTGGWFSLLLVPPEGLGVARGAALAKVEVKFGGMQVSEVYPRRIPDLVPGRPVVITGRFMGVPGGSVMVTGMAGERPVAYTLSVAGAVEENPAIATVWARAKVADLREGASLDNRDVSAEVKETALRYGIVSEYTGFVAVDATGTTGEGAGQQVVVPVPEGVRYETTVPGGEK